MTCVMRLCVAWQDEDSDGMISKWEFTVHLLKLWGLVDDVIMAAITRRFAVR